MTIDRRTPSALLVALLTATGPSVIGQSTAPSGPVRRLPPPPSSPAFELDPLRMIKLPAEIGSGADGTGPNVVIAMDTSLRMAYDYQGNYYDLRIWDKEGDPAAASGLGVAPSARYYRRKFSGLQRSLVGGAHFKSRAIEAIDETEPGYANFFDLSRLGMARDGVAQAIVENQSVVRFGLVRSRYGDGATLPIRGNQSPVNVTPAILPGDVGSSGSWSVSVALTSTNNIDAPASGAEVIVRADSNGASAAVLSQLRLAPDEEGGLLPAGADADLLTDAPVGRLLEDTRSEVTRLINADVSSFRPCRNTVVVLVTGGREGGTADPVAAAGGFANIVAGGTSKPVPIFVVAVGPQAADQAQLQQIAAVSRGKYFATDNADEIALAVNHAVQSAYRLVSDFDAHRPSEFQTVGPVVGTVDLTGAKDLTGALLPDTAIVSDSGRAIPQRGNVVVTGGFTLPGFGASLRAFRVYRPQASRSGPAGHRFVSDGTRLWVAFTPQAERRNIFTYIPGSGVIRFDATQAPLLRTYLRLTTDAEAESLINFLRAEPLGAVIDSTPTILDPPSLEPAPDNDYGGSDRPGTFAGDRRNRRAIVFYGGNDGMIHGIDARLGVEVWAFIPFNLLPKLRSLRDGQPVGAFEYFADGSAKIADVKVNGTWRTYMVIGQGAGGTFYQTFDVSDAGLGLGSASDNLSAVLAAFSMPEVIPLKWTFPRYEAFDPTVSTAVTPFGDLGAAATTVEMTVGQTWSQPAIGRLDPDGGYVMVVGSGYLSADQERQGARGQVRAGTTFYVIDMASGAVLDHQDVSDDPARSLLKNALHSDPSLAGPVGTRLVSHAYIGDTEGVFWRFNFVQGQNGAVRLDPAVKIYDFSEGNPIFSPPALVDVAAATRYIFLSTGTTILPRAKKLQNFKLIGLLDTDDGQGVKRFEVALDRSDGRPGDERPASAPAVAGDAVFFATTTDFPDNPCATPESDLRALTYVGGPIYDTTGDDKVDGKDSVIIARMTGRATTLTTVDRHVMLVAGSALESFGDPADFNNGVREGSVRLLSWRELR